MRIFKNLFLYFSSFIPLYFLLIVKLLVDILNGNLTFDVLNIVSLSMNGLLILLGIVGFLWNTKFSKSTEIEVKVKSATDITDKYFLQYFSLFVLFAVPFDISYFNEFFIYIIVLVFIGVVYINCGLFYINPFLNILGYRFFETTYVAENGETKVIKIFSKKSLTQGETYKVKFDNKHFAFVICEVKKI